MEIKSLLSKKRLLFAPGDLPWDSLIAPDNRQLLQQTFKFDTAALVQANNAPSFRCAMGQLSYENAVRSIPELTVQTMAIDATVDGDSSAADHLIQVALKLLRGFSPQTPAEEAKPREVSYETYCICRLNPDCRGMLSDKYLSFLESDVLSKIGEGYPNAEPVLLPGHIQFNFIFKMKVATHLIAPKTFAIESRDGTTPEEHLYWTTSPTRSEVHLQILREFEKKFTTQVSRRKSK